MFSVPCCVCRTERLVASARTVCTAGSTKRHGVRPSVRLSVCPTAANPPLQICCCGPGGQEMPIDRCSSGVRRENAGSGALSAYVGSWRHSCIRRSGRGDVETGVRCTKWTASTDRSFESAALVTNSVATTSPFLPPKTRPLARSAR